jgi:general secretion pathway protein D
VTPRHATTTLTLTMLSLCALARAEEAPTPPATPGSDDASLAEHRSHDQQVAGGLYVQAMRAKDEGRLDDAVKLLAEVVRLQPENQTYRQADDQVKAMAGVNPDSRSVTIDRVTDAFDVKQQQLWVEAEAKIEEGQRAMEAGNFSEAQRDFEMAGTRLDTLPFADERKAPELRRVAGLRQEAQTRREKADQEASSERNRQAESRQQQLRDLSLQIERDRINAMLARAERGRQRRDFDEAILLCDQILKINRAEERASILLAKCRRERHVYLRQMTADRWDEEHKLLSEQIRTAMLPQLEIIKYSSDWPELDARRTAPTRGLDEQNETWRKVIQEQLEQEVHVEFADTSLEDVVTFLQRVTNVNIIIDPAVLTTSPPPVTLTVDHTPLKSVLDLIMRVTNLNYVLKDEAIYISNTQGVRGDVYMKLYDVRDLTHAMQSFPGPELDIPDPGGQGAKLLPPVEPDAHPDTQEFIDIIQHVVAPNEWASPGVSIEEYQGAMVITQTADVHRQVEELLRELRNQKGTQIHVKVRFLEIENSALQEIGVDWNNYTGPRNPTATSGQLASIPGLTTGTTTGTGQGQPNTLGAYYGNTATGIITAAAVNNQLPVYQTANSLQYANSSGGPGLNFQSQTWQVASNWYASAVLHAVEEERKGNVVFEPDLTMFNGQQGHIIHMNQQSYIADYNVVQGQYEPIVTILSYGTVLDVQAIASADKKYITLTLRPTNAQVLEWRSFGPLPTAGSFPGGTVVPGGNGQNNANPNSGGTITPGGTGGTIAPGGTGQAGSSNPAVADANPLLIPELSYESVRTSVTIPDGGSLVIAGFSDGESARSHAGIPFLSHIPFLGRLFSTNGSQETERKTLIMVEADLVLFDEIERNL